MHKLLLSLLLFLNTLVNAQLIKISNLDTSLSSNVKVWACVLDTHTNLLWEVKQNTKGLQSSNNTYTWFDGISGEENGKYSHHCHWLENCNTQAFIDALNNAKLCRSSVWRLPNEAELNTLLVYNDDNPLINTNYFPNTESELYWTAVEGVDDVETAISVPFFYGGTRANGKSFDAYVRGVSNAN